MKKIHSLLFLLVLVFAGNLKAQTLPPYDSAYHLIFADDFDTTAVRLSKWGQNYNFGQNPNKIATCNGDSVDLAYRRWYKNNNTTALGDTHNIHFYNSGGTTSAILATLKETFTGSTWAWLTCGGPSVCNGSACDIPSNTCLHTDSRVFKYTTSMLLSRNKFKFGYFEIKFKLPDPSTLPAGKEYNCGPNFWLYGANSDLNHVLSPWSEIDIFEIKGKTNLFTSTYHYQHYPDSVANRYHGVDGVNYGSISAGWHTAGCWWRSDGIDVYLDNNLVHSITNDSINPDSMAPMQMYVDLNSPSINFCDSFSTNSYFPYNYEIDYVKVWQTKEDCGTPMTICTPGLVQATYDSKVYQYISIGGSGCSTSSVSSASNFSFWGKDYVQLDEGFSIDGSSNVIISTHSCKNVYAPAIIGSDPPASWTERQKVFH